MPFPDYIVAVGVALTCDLPPWEEIGKQELHRSGHVGAQQPEPFVASPAADLDKRLSDLPQRADRISGSDTQTESDPN
jgi:hypothetical protein